MMPMSTTWSGSMQQHSKNPHVMEVAADHPGVGVPAPFIGPPEPLGPAGGGTSPVRRNQVGIRHTVDQYSPATASATSATVAA